MLPAGPEAPIAGPSIPTVDGPAPAPRTGGEPVSNDVHLPGLLAHGRQVAISAVLLTRMDTATYLVARAVIGWV